jgi:2-aminobenzoate-CoA ligase
MCSVPASITIQRRVEWTDTDAAGHQHFTAILRWAEQAELLLHERLGISDVTLGRCPRVRVEAEYLKRLWPQAVVDVEIAVKRVGRSSVVYDFAVRHDGEDAARGVMTAVHVEGGAGSSPWPDHARHALMLSGRVDGERFALDH